jgi:creatinine amidohydrolase
MLPRRQWAEMTWVDFRDGNPADWIAVLPVAAVEQHGPHLPLGVDAMIAEGYLARVQALLPEALPVTFLPLQAVGKSDEHIFFPGTLTLGAEVATQAWIDLGESVHRAGVQKLVIVNSHGGNSALLELVARALRVRAGMFVVTAGWGRFGYPAGLFSQAEITHGIHGGEIETSILLALRPELVRMDKAENFTPATLGMDHEFKWLRADRPAGFGWSAQDLNPAGAIGNAKAATREKGEAALEHGARAFIELLEDVRRFDVTRLNDGPSG